MAGHPGRAVPAGTQSMELPRHSPAGSSSGSAAAVAAGFSPATLGTDTGGSIRSPAAACGIAGLKPTYGLVSRRGVIPNCFSHDHAGPLAWTTEDVAILLQVIAGHDPEDPGSADVPIPDYAAALTGEVKGLTIGVPVNWLDDEAPPTAPTKAAFEAALDVFRGLGASVRSVTLPPLQQYDDAKKTIAVVELFTIHAVDLRTRPELFGASLRYRIVAGGLVRAEEYVQAMRLRTDLARAMQAAMADVDLLMLPTGEPAGKLEPIPPSSLFTRTSFTTPFNVGGNPALSVCNGFAANGMPFSLQIVGRLFDECSVLRAGDAYEKATPWRDQRPGLARQGDRVKFAHLLLWKSLAVKALLRGPIQGRDLSLPLRRCGSALLVAHARVTIVHTQWVGPWVKLK